MKDNIGAYIKKARENKGWSQRKLGDEIDISQSTISDWEKGKLIPAPEMIAIIVRATNDIELKIEYLSRFRIYILQKYRKIRGY